MMIEEPYTPGSLVRARGREWIVLSSDDPEIVPLRPITGCEDDLAYIHLGLEPGAISEAVFPAPSADQKASHDSALLLRDALLLSMRRGAGPFRSFGQIAVEPRAYQLVPLLMALKLDPVRLLIADDVGIGKTIEGALIARELLDRGDIERTTVLCPPHLVDQWVTELEARFHIRPVAVTAASANWLERGMPPTESIFTTWNHTVVSLDYIKSERHRSDFLRACPEFVIVDEAHTCAAAGRGHQQRYELLKSITECDARHLVLLTATPHSGDEAAFYRLLGLLDSEFQTLPESEGKARKTLRDRLARHFVQRRRPDIKEWQEGNAFPRRETAELTYRLSGAWEKFFDEVLDYCASVVQAAGGDARRERLSFWGTLALMRCVASSPAAAAQALRTRAGTQSQEDEESIEDHIFDGGSDALIEDDLEPPVANDDPRLKRLIKQAESLTGKADDPKLKLLIDHLAELIKEGFSPVVFCRYIATAHYLGRHLDGHFPDVTVAVITGELTPDERKERAEILGEAETRVLIATDCLSEGINLQESFDAVVHYDLSWNPTRHEQREGRVDRFGQNGPVKDKKGRTIVRATLIYGANNPVDGAVLEVILRKAAKIREELGVPVPLPDDGHILSKTLLKAVMLRKAMRDQNRQEAFEFGAMDEAKAIETQWQDAVANTKRNRTVFAQQRLKPEEVLPEWHKSLATIGSRDDVHRFMDRALGRLGSGLEPLSRKTWERGAKVPLATLPEDVRERLEAEDLEGTIYVDFKYPAAPRCLPVQRSHPLVSVLAETLLERTLGMTGADPSAYTDPGVLGRIGAWVSAAVSVRTTVALLRLRHQLVTERTVRNSTMLVEEATAIAWAGASEPTITEGDDAFELIAAPPVADPPPHVRERAVAQALEQLQARRPELDAFAERRAQALLADHRRVREASKGAGQTIVKALLPGDVIGLYVLLPKLD